MYDPLIFELMTPNAKYIHVLSLMVIHPSVLMIMQSQAIFAYITSPMTSDLDLMTPKSNQFIGSARYIHDQSLVGIHESVLEITRSQAIFAYIMSPLTFDLVTPKSNQFIGSASYIHDQSLVGIHQSVLEITRSRERDVRTDVSMYGRTDGQPENIMPLATS